MARERWGSKFGVILAVAGSAVGLGNFLRFPGLVAENGGGAFLVPYFMAVLLLGLPLMWVEWTIGRFGGGFGHSTAPGVFHSMWRKNRFIKYFGVIGIFGPLVILTYYTYVESWLLGFSYYAATGKYAACETADQMGAFLSGYRGEASNEFFDGIGPAYLFFLITFAVNMLVIAGGIRGGIEKFCKIAMPALLVLSIILIIRVFTLGTPDPELPEQSVSNGLGFLWNPDFSKMWGQYDIGGVWLFEKFGWFQNGPVGLPNFKLFLNATGQVFFTLSVGIGSILTYASYLRKRDDVALSGLTAATTNELAEVILGASIVIPAAVVFLGMAVTRQYSSTFDLGFITMPLAMNQMPFGGQAFSLIWFLLLFLAGVTSSISLAQPVVAFLQDEFDLTRKEAVLIFGIVLFVLIHAVIFGGDVLGELDFWGVNVCLVVFGLVEVIMFGWVFGIDKAWKELHVGGDIMIPGIYRFIIKYITPALLLVILIGWLVQEGIREMFFIGENLNDPDIQMRIMTRVVLALVFAILCFMVWAVWRRRRRTETEEVTS
jgi:NSS family neurotransmitter:Na+ symporter